MSQDLNPFSQFAKSSPSTLRVKSSNAVIYTRVSSKEQTENLSLDTQKRICSEFAKRSNYQVIGYFGGTYESAKTDERKEFNRMLQFVRRSKEKISHIIVYNEDRFSRTGANAIYIANELKNEGILVHAAMNPVDTQTPGGSLQQNIKFIFGQYDNDIRRERIMAGMREKMMRGYWACKPPIGYDSIRVNGQQTIIINKKGELLRKAFEWKAAGIANMEILNRLKGMGLSLQIQMLQKIFMNPFYCGILSHGLLNGQLVEGKHKAIVTKELFLLVNDMQALKKHDHKHKETFDEVPLKHFVKCGSCGRPMAGYVVKKKGLWYYKCQTRGCCLNKSAKLMHDLFVQEIKQYQISTIHMGALRVQLEKTFHKMTEGKPEEEKAYKTQITELQKKMETLEERFALGEIDREMYAKFHGKYREEKQEIEKLLEKSSIQISNLEEYLDFALELSSNLHNMWEMSNYSQKERLQYLVFPEGLAFDRSLGSYRTSRVNVVFSLIASLKGQLGERKKGAESVETLNSLSVVRRGIEPLLPE